VLVGWCTLRQDYRAFRADNIRTFKPLEEKLPRRRKSLLVEWKREQLMKYDMPDAMKEAAGKMYGG